MKILAFDTCWQACSVVVADYQAPDRLEILGHRFAPMATGQAEVLPVMLRDVLDEAGCKARDIDRIAVPNGPGSFTGVRISVAAARAMRLSTGADLVSCSSLALLAAGVIRAEKSVDPQRESSGPSRASEPKGNEILVAMDARRGEAYVQLFNPSPDWPTLPEPQLLALPEAAELCQSQSFDVLGTAADMIAVEATRKGRQPRVLSNVGLPDALHLAWIAPRLDPLRVPLAPVYIRQPDAKPSTKPTIQRTEGQSA